MNTGRHTGVGAKRLLPLAALVLGACGYTMVKQSTFRAHRLPADSVEIVSLQQQVIALQTQCRADSIRYANLKASPPPPAPATPDSVLHARDDEIAALKDQLTQLNAELDRIKRRLANPKH